MTRRTCVVAFTLFWSACGGGAELTCEVIADPMNCWNAAAAAAKACVPENEIAVFSADRTGCTFSDGTRIVFDEALPMRTEDISQELEDLAFTIEKDGSTCARFVDTLNNRMELTAGGHEAVSQLHPDREFELVCGGGESYSADFDRIFECAAEGAYSLTDGFELEPGFVRFLIVAPTAPGDLFRCETQ